MTTRPASAPPHVAVVGGGLAGIAAGIALAENGLRVSVFEARPRLGGATHSFQRGELTVDNGQHVFLRCYTAYRELLRRIGVADLVTLQERFDVAVLSPDGRQARLSRSNLPGPLHLGRALATYGMLSPRERLSALRAAAALRTTDVADPDLDARDFGAWLADRGQSERAIRDLWELFIVAGLNAPAAEASASLASMVVKTALLGGRDAADIGFPAVPLSRLHADAGAVALTKLGVRVLTRSKVSAVAPVEPGRPGESGGGYTVTVGGEHLHADAVVLAVPHDSAVRVLPDDAGSAPDRLASLGAAPIVNVHAVFDRRVTSLPFAASVRSPAQWVFDRTAVAGLDPRYGQGQYLAVSVSAADAHIDRPTRELRAEFLPALARLFPRASDAEVTQFFVTRERRATFRQSPGSGALRPPAATLLPGLLIAGAWTDTGWPDTMEGAVRSGLVAARGVSEYLRTRSVRAHPGDAGSDHVQLTSSLEIPGVMA